MDLNDPTTVALLAADAFGASSHKYALYGGLLTAVYGEPRETRDADVAVIDLTAERAREALLAVGVQPVLAFEDVTFGGLSLSRLTIMGSESASGLNTIDLVRPRSDRYARLAVTRAAESTLRGRQVRLLTLEDFVLFKVLSTRDRDLEDARMALRRSGSLLERDTLEREIALLAAELDDVDVKGRWTAIQS